MTLITTDVPPMGFVTIVDQLGTDTTVVNSARVSFGRRVVNISEQDEKLLAYLVRHGHFSPFRHAAVQFHIAAPEYVARQWYKHIIGSDYAFKDTAWNEISGRYVDVSHHCPPPLAWRAAPANKKQGSGGELDNQHGPTIVYRAAVSAAQAAYRDLLSQGVAPEQARIVLPMAFVTEWYWTASLQAIFHFVTLRSDQHAQAEIRAFAEAIDKQMSFVFPKAWAALHGPK